MSDRPQRGQDFGEVLVRYLDRINYRTPEDRLVSSLARQPNGRMSFRDYSLNHLDDTAAARETVSRAVTAGTVAVVGRFGFEEIALTPAGYALAERIAKYGDRDVSGP